MDLFNTENTSKVPDQVKVEDLVGEGKKYKTYDDLAKAYVHADTHIERVLAEKAEESARRARLEQEALTRTSVEDAIRNLQAQNANGNLNRQTGNVVTQTPAVEAKKADFTLEDVDKLLEKKEQERKANANLAMVSEAILRVAGDQAKAQDLLSKKAAALGIPLLKLRDLGAESPAAVLRLLDIDTKKQAVPVSPMEQRVGTPNIQSERKFSFEAPMDDEDYRKLRKEKPSLYDTPAVQNKLLKDKMDKIKRERGLI